MESKNVFLSKTLWASVAIIVAAALNQFGVEVDSTSLAETLFNAVTAVFALIAFVGRLVAKTKLTL